MQEKKDRYIVGIGASAGGFDALKKFFKALPDNVPAAFVVIQHLSPHYESNLHKILEDFTSMPVIKVNEEVEVKTGHVYVIPEKKQLKLRNSSIIPEERPLQKVVNLAIDIFFETMAMEHGDKSIGIVLSGTGSDGARGVQIIKSRGGVVMVQSPQSASFDSMPTVAITSDSPDYIASPDILAKELAEFIKSPETLDKEKLKESSNQRDTLQEIIQEVSAYSGVNFQGYKLGTVIRRIEKRMKINHLKDLQEYENYLRRHPKELQHLYRDFLIGVTRFFRDPEVYESLEKNVIPILCKKNGGVEPIRIWSVACSTGEEAYSLAMLFDEYISRHNLNLEFKIFATDVDQRGIDIASAGRYSAAIEEDVSPERLNRYFNQIGEYYEIKKDLRRQIIFSKHNLIGDPPFIRQDLITCRNVFIYLLDEVQNKVLQTFNYSLKQDGFLLLGATESVNEQDNLFDAVDIRNKIFKNKPGAALRPHRPIAYQISEPQFHPSSAQIYRNWVHATTPDEHYADLVAERFAPPSMIINRHEDVLYTTGTLNNYLHFPNKRVDLNVYSMLRGKLILVFRNALRQLANGETSVLFKDCLVEGDQQQHLVDLKFSTLENSRPEPLEKLYLVEFWEKEMPPNGLVTQDVKVVEHDNYSKAEVENLEQELKIARRQLRITADELETINEEMQSANEELQSANEELQSTNEELQSSNEELQTVNIELKNKIDAVTTLHDDINNLFNSTQLAAIFLDSSTNIRKFTPPAKHYFNVRETDIGRPLGHYSYNFKHPDFQSDIEKVLEQFLPVEHEVEHKDGTYSIMRILPYKTESRQVKGVVITFTDITELKQSNNKLLKLTEEVLANERHLKSLLDHTPDFIVRFDQKLRYSFVNRALLDASGLSYIEFLGRERVGLRMLKEDKETQRLMREVLIKREVQGYYYTYSSESGEKHYYVKLVPEFSDEDSEVKSILSISTDITQLKIAERRLLNKNKILSEIYDRMDNFVHAIAHDLRTPMVNLKMLADLFKQTKKEEEREEFVQMIGNSVRKLDNTLNGLIRIIEVANENELNNRKLSFADVTKSVLQEFKAPIAQHDVVIETNFEECPTIYYADVYLNSILQNLISNAIKYHHPRRKPHITVSTSCTDDFIVLTVADNGLGIDLNAVQNNLFRPFKRFHQETSGMGVGLYIIKYMVERYGGRIEVESNVNEGTKFILYLKSYEEENNTAD